MSFPLSWLFTFLMLLRRNYCCSLVAVALLVEFLDRPMNCEAAEGFKMDSYTAPSCESLTLGFWLSLMFCGFTLSFEKVFFFCRNLKPFFLDFRFLTELPSTAEPVPKFILDSKSAFYYTPVLLIANGLNPGSNLLCLRYDVLNPFFDTFLVSELDTPGNPISYGGVLELFWFPSLIWSPLGSSIIPRLPWSP